MMAAFPGNGHGDLADAYPAACLGMILHTPDTEPGPAALRAIQPATATSKKSALDSIDNPQLRLPHGRVAQTLLDAVIIFVANLRAVRRFLRELDSAHAVEDVALELREVRPHAPRNPHRDAQPSSRPW
jgi:hypothetical protein